MEKRLEQFENLISVGLRNNKMQEPLIEWYGELYVKYNIAGNQLSLFKLVQAINLVNEYKEIVTEINELNSIERDLLIAKATICKLEQRSEKELIDKFGFVEKFRVAYAMGLIERDKSSISDWFYGLSKEDKNYIRTLADRIANDLKVT